MKKQLIIATLALGAIVFGTNNVLAQNNTATTAVNIILADVISIDGTSVANGGAVDFTYNTASDYYTTKNAVVENSLKVTSTKNFNITVKAAGDSFVGPTANIPLDVMTIKPSSGGTMQGTEHTITPSTTDQILIGNVGKGYMLTLTLDYEISAAKASSSDILGKPAEIYTQTVTYTATAL
jgi:hypothetical protein